MDLMEEKFGFWAFKLSGIIIVFFILQNSIPGFTDFFVLNQSAFPQIWRFVSAVFLHGGLGHIAYNLFALVLFGSMLERLIGSRRFLYVFFVTGILANLFSVNFYPSSLGASGAIFGVIGALILVRPGLMVWAFGLPMPIFVAGILWAAGDIIGAVGFFSGNPLDNTGNLAHLSGMAFGLAMGLYYKRKGFVKNLQGPAGKSRKHEVYVNEDYARRWEDRYLGS
jgi:uncharacterized protein